MTAIQLKIQHLKTTRGSFWLVTVQWCKKILKHCLRIEQLKGIIDSDFLQAVHFWFLFHSTCHVKASRGNPPIAHCTWDSCCHFCLDSASSFMVGMFYDGDQSCQVESFHPATRNCILFDCKAVLLVAQLFFAAGQTSQWCQYAKNCLLEKGFPYLYHFKVYFVVYLSTFNTGYFLMKMGQVIGYCFYYAIQEVGYLRNRNSSSLMDSFIPYRF